MEPVIIYPMQASDLAWLLNVEEDNMGPTKISQGMAGSIIVTLDNGHIYKIATDGTTTAFN